MEDIQSEQTMEVPNHLKDTHYPGAKKLGHGKGYKYPHAYPDGWVEQCYLPERVEGRWFRPQAPRPTTASVQVRRVGSVG